MNTLSQQMNSLPLELQFIVYNLNIRKLKGQVLDELLDCKEAVFWGLESHINRSPLYNTNMEEKEYNTRIHKFLTLTQLRPTDVVDYIEAKKYFDTL